MQIKTYFQNASIAVFITALLLGSRAMVAQSTQPAKSENFAAGSDISVGLMGQMTFARNPTTTAVSSSGTTFTQLTESESPSAGALVTFHHAWKPYVGYNVNFSYTRFAQLNSLAEGFTPAAGSPPGSTGSFGGGVTDRHMFEMSAAYAIYGPRTKRFRTTAQLGAGELVFDPISPAEAHELKSCATLLFGVGGEYDLSRHLSLRAEYRGLLYRTPNTPYAYYFPEKRLYTVTNLPAVSLVYHFGSRSHAGKVQQETK